MTNIVILDGYVANPGDQSWQALSDQGSLTVYDRTTKDLLYERAKGAHILIVNKCPLDREVLYRLDDLRCICTLATGYNNIDIVAAKERDILVCNAVGYSSPSVAQQVFALLLELTNRVGLHNESVQQNGWANSIDWCYWKSPMMELSGKTMGIYGLGKIGQETAKIALAFGMKVIATRRNPSKPTHPNINLVAIEQLLRDSDVLSLHAPLTLDNKHIINKENLAKMKPSAFLINTGRGDLIQETELKNALLNGVIAGAGLDVLSQEPPPKNHLLLGVPNCLITPHQAWASRESRARLIQIVADNVKAFLSGKAQNVI